MGTKTPKPPPTIDYAGAAAAQGAANVTAAGQTTALSNPNIVGPYGNQTVTYAPDAQGNMQPTVTQTLNADAQKALTSQQKTQAGLAGIGENLTNQVSGSLSKQFQFNGPDIQTSLGPQRSINYGPTGDAFGLAGGGPAADAYGLASGIDPTKALRQAVKLITMPCVPKVSKPTTCIPRRLCRALT